mmetsp:Transcript_94360/g.192063  ORF Transcript_94360/g.192063 Transcript_94360/m.192063 type:complete len:277 (-) Transcript_94360:68-898(-)
MARPSPIGGLALKLDLSAVTQGAGPAGVGTARWAQGFPLGGDAGRDPAATMPATPRGRSPPACGGRDAGGRAAPQFGFPSVAEAGGSDAAMSLSQQAQVAFEAPPASARSSAPPPPPESRSGSARRRITPRLYVAEVISTEKARELASAALPETAKRGPEAEADACPEDASSPKSPPLLLAPDERGLTSSLLSISNVSFSSDEGQINTRLKMTCLEPATSLDAACGSTREMGDERSRSSSVDEQEQCLTFRLCEGGAEHFAAPWAEAGPHGPEAAA